MGDRDAPRSGAPGALPDEAPISHERFRDLVEHAVDLIVELDAGGRLLYVSPGIREILGYESSELVDTNALDLVHPDDRRSVASDHARLEQKGRTQSMHRVRHYDGSWRWIQNTARMFQTGSGELRILAIGRDLTAAKALETTLERQAAMQEGIAALSRRFLALEHHEIEDGIREQLPVAAELAGAERTTLIVVGAGQPPPGAVYYWERPGTPGPPPRHDPAVAQDFQWSRRTLGRGEVLHVPGLEALPPEAVNERADILRRGVQSLLAIPVCSGNTIFGYQVFECVAQRKRWTEQEITQLRLVGEIFASAIKRRQSEEEIAQRRVVELGVAALSRRFLALGPDEIDEAIRQALAEAADLARADRSLLYSAPVPGRAEPAYYEWCAKGVAPSVPIPTAWSTRKILAGEVVRIANPADLPEQAAAERQAMEARGVRSSLGIPVRSGDETLGFLGFECMNAEREWSEQDVTLLRMIGELFTAALHRKRAEEALRQSRAQLLQAQKLEAVGRLAGGIAHDFNNLLTVILGFSRPLLAELQDNDPAREDVSEIHAAAERAAALTRQLLTFSRRQTLVSHPVDLNHTLTELEQLLHRLLGEDIDLVLEIASDLGLVKIDPHQLEQVVMNIAVNARDAMPDGGSLHLRTECREIDPLEAHRLGLADTGAYVMLRVTDSGCGMDEQTRARIFDPFFTTKEPGKGTGLGLSIVYTVIEQAGGAIVVNARPTKGTTFEIYLPVDEHDDATAAGGSERVPARTGSECVLVVEDDDAVRRLTRLTLEQNGYRVLEAENGERAISVAHEHPDSIDVLVTDVVMPRLGGGELARRLCELRPALKVLFTSGYPQQDPSQTSQRLPEGGFLEKPFGKEDLLAKLREALES